MKLMLRILLLLFLLSSLNGSAQDLRKSEITIGETLEYQSSVLDEQRTLNVYLPQSYGTDSTKSYPVVYLLDGSKDEDFIHIAGLVQFCSFSWIQIIPESIVVGIGNIDRKRDFTFPTNNEKDKADFPTTGHSAKFIAFLEKELQPLISETYRVTDDRTLIGQSLGGLLAAEVLYTQPQLFDNYVIVSPSLWWDDESLLKCDLPADLIGKSVYVGVGKEGEVMERTARELHAKLEAGITEQNQVYFGFFEEQNHGDALHLAVYDSFEQIFAKHKDDH